MNESYFLLAALRRKAGSPKEPDLCESDCEVIAPGGGLASPSSRFLHQACERCWSRVPVVPDEGTERTDGV